MKIKVNMHYAKKENVGENVNSFILKRQELIRVT